MVKNQLVANFFLSWPKYDLLLLGYGEIASVVVASAYKEHSTFCCVKTLVLRNVA